MDTDARTASRTPASAKLAFFALLGAGALTGCRCAVEIRPVDSSLMVRTDRSENEVGADLSEHLQLKESPAQAGRWELPLKPGMRIRVESVGFESPSSIANQERGYAESPPRQYVVLSAAEGRLVLEPYLAFLRTAIEKGAFKIVNEKAPRVSGSVLDLEKPVAPRKFYRLVLPLRNTAYPPSDHDRVLIPANHTYLVGAEANELLDNAYLDCDDPERCGCGESATCRSVVRFRGRVWVVPEIPISFRGSRRFVSVGTTVRQLLEEEGIRIAVGAGQPCRLPGLVLERWTGQHYESVCFGRSKSPVKDLDSLDAPLHMHDRVWIRASQ